MIRKILACVVFTFLTNTGYAAPANNPQEEAGYGTTENYLPEGEYQNICRSCRIDDKNQLICQCPKDSEADNGERPAKWVLRTVDLDSCEENRVNLINGYLFCDNASEDEIESIKGTEGQPVMDEDGAQVDEPPLDTPPSGVHLDQNMNVIAPKPEKNRLPEIEKPIASPPAVFDYNDVDESDLVPLPLGDYIKYCQSCKVSNGILNCECYPKTTLFSYTSAAISIQSCGKGEPITYRGGALICQKDLQRTLPGGSCWDCEVKDNELSCTCLKTPCQWSREDLKKGRREYRSTLEDFRYCTSKIVNCNGQLRCGGCNFYDYYEEILRPYEGKRIAHYCYHFSPKYRFIEDWWWQ